MLLAELEDPDSQASRIWNEEHDRHVMHILLRQLRAVLTPAHGKHSNSSRWPIDLPLM